MLKILIVGLLIASFPIFSQNTAHENAIQSVQKLLVKDHLHIVKNKYDFINDLCSSPNCEDSFHIVDVGIIADRFSLWQENLPSIVPYYAVKTNNDYIMTSVLASLGVGFDCASKNEIEQIKSHGIDPSRIIFAHPRKPASAIHYAKETGVNLLTFDSIEELHKLLKLYPEANLVLRIKTDDAMSVSPLSQKFGATLSESYKILDEGFSNGAQIIGIAFHVGSNCTHLESYQKAILDAADLFQYSYERWNKKLSLLDLGGGWPGTDDQSFIKIAQLVNELLPIYFPKETKYIAEPGRFFASQTTTLIMKVLGKKKLEEENKIQYYLTNGAFGFFISSIYFNHNQEKISTEGWVFKPLSKKNQSNHLFQTLLWGPTCDSEDKIVDGILLPEMEADDFLAVENAGSYTKSLETAFNGIPLSKPHYICEIKQ